MFPALLFLLTILSRITKLSGYTSKLQRKSSGDIKNIYIKKEQGFPGGAVVENLPANAGDTGSSPGLGRSHMPRSN